MQKSRHTAFFAFKVQGEKAVRYALFSLHQSGHAKNGKEGNKMRKRALFRGRDPCFPLLSRERKVGSTLAGAMPKRRGGAGRGGAMPKYLWLAPDADPRDASVSVVASVA
jgi:hypothetical protein